MQRFSRSLVRYGRDFVVTPQSAFRVDEAGRATVFYRRMFLTLKLKSCFLEQSENNLNWIEPAHDIIKEARYHACSLLSVQVVKIRLEPRGTLEISIEKAKQEGRLTATAGKKQDWYIWLDPLHCRPYDTARRVGKVVFQKNTVYLHSC